MRHQLFKVPFLAAATAFCVLATGPLVAQQGDYDSDPQPTYDPLKTDLPAETRVAQDVQQIAELAGESLGGEISPLLSTTLSSKATDDARLESIGRLEEIIGGLDRTQPVENAIYRKVSRRAYLARSLVSALQATEATDEARAIANDLLIRSTVDYESGNRVAHTDVARQRYQQLKDSYPQIYEAVRVDYNRDFFNYNLHFVVSENLIQQLVSDIRCESGPVKDCILGAYVTGTQVTNTELQADVRPSTSTAAFDLVVKGNTHSNTSGTKSPAVIYTRGQHHFNITKPVYFDGQSISSGVADMQVNANNQTIGVSTKYDRIPLLGGLARKIAFKEAQKKKTQSEAIAARKLADKAIPRFESEVNAKFSEANTNLQTNLFDGLEARGILPDSYSARSSDTHIAVSSRTITSDTLAADLAPGIPVTSTGLSVQIHESALNAGIGSLKLSGRMSIEDVLIRVEEALSEFARKPVSLRSEDEELDTNTEFDFDPSDPIRVRLEEGRAVFLLRTGFYQLDKDRRIPRHSFEVPVEFSLGEGGLQLTAPNTESRTIARVIKPKSIEEGASPRSIIQARAIAKKLIDGAFKEDIQTIDANVDVKLGGGQTLPLTFSHFEISDGWISAVLD